ncbi:MAG: DUF4266 domain-containing protein [SAR324 cluster bacterium]|nr:DUF4266 domain-containing protein [SAR324 cluster bacterium]
MLNSIKITGSLLICFGLIMVLSSCRNVRPIERRYLSHRFMQLSPDPVRESFEDKIFDSREAAAGGKGATAGGGCGCN